MTTAAGSASSRRSLRDDLLSDLRQGAVLGARPVTAPPDAQTPGVPSADPPALELRITPRSWSSAGWSSSPGGGGFVVTVGPLRLSVGRAGL